MLYSEKGSKIFPADAARQIVPDKNRIIGLTYIDAPIFLKWYLKNQANVWHLELGGIYGRLISTDITESITNVRRDFSYEGIVQDFEKDEISALFGIGYSWAGGMAVNLRYVVGVSKFYKDEDFEFLPIGSTTPQGVEFLRNYYYSLSLSYTIFKRSLKNKSRKR